MELNGEVQLPEIFIEKIDKCFRLFNKELNRQETIEVIKKEVNLAIKHGRILPNDMISGTIARGEEITAEAVKEFKIIFGKRWKLLIKSELSKMEPNETSLVDSWKIQQFTDIFVTELTSALNESKDKLGKMLSDRRYIKCFCIYY